MLHIGSCNYIHIYQEKNPQSFNSPLISFKDNKSELRRPYRIQPSVFFRNLCTYVYYTSSLITEIIIYVTISKLQKEVTMLLDYHVTAAANNSVCSAFNINVEQVRLTTQVYSQSFRRPT